MKRGWRCSSAYMSIMKPTAQTPKTVTMLMLACLRMPCLCSLVCRQADGDRSLPAEVVDLERGVLDLEALGEEALEVAPDRMAVVPWPYQDVGRKGGEPGRDLPHVQVVDVR